MPLLMLRDLPRFECLLEASERYPALEPTAFNAFLHLLRTGDLVFGAENEFLHDRGLSQGRFTVLMLLNRCCSEPKTPAELADEASVTRATITGLLDNLERDGMVVRETSPGDRRTVLVRLTDKGQRCIDMVLPHYCRRVSALMEPLSEAERTTLVALLQKVQQGLAPADSAAHTPAPAIASA